MTTQKLALIFPGIGYHVDKPLLYYSKKLARSYGYQVVEVLYGNFPKEVKGDRDKMQDALTSALAQSEDLLKDVDFSAYPHILCISKSIGTAVASAFMEQHGIFAHHIYYTPVEEFLPLMKQPGIVFHGTNDSWADTQNLLEACQKKSYPVYQIPDGNHSLETGDIFKDLEYLHKIMKRTKEYLEDISIK